MKVTVSFLGTLSKYTGADSVEIELQDGALYGDLLAELNNRFGARLPEKCWDREKAEFIKPISAISSTGDLDSKKTPLLDKQEIHVLIPISGGWADGVRSYIMTFPRKHPFFARLNQY